MKNFNNLSCHIYCKDRFTQETPNLYLIALFYSHIQDVDSGQNLEIRYFQSVILSHNLTFHIGFKRSVQTSEGKIPEGKFQETSLGEKSRQIFIIIQKKKNMRKIIASQQRQPISACRNNFKLFYQILLLFLYKISHVKILIYIYNKGGYNFKFLQVF